MLVKKMIINVNIPPIVFKNSFFVFKLLVFTVNFLEIYCHALH